MIQPRHKGRASQGGTILILLLVLLLLVSIMGLSSVRQSTTTEKIVGNVRDRNRAQQAAEAVVQNCLQQVHDSTYPPGKILTPSDAALNIAPNWEIASNWADGAAASLAVPISSAGLSSDPRCMVETLGSGGYRVTGRALGGSPDTEVILQATYSTE